MTERRVRRAVRGGFRAWLCTIALAGGLAGGSAQAASEKIFIYAALDENVVTEIARAFRAHSGLGAELVAVAAAGTLASRLRRERGTPRVDVLVGGSVDVHAALGADGLLMPYESPVFAQSAINPAFADEDGRWYGWHLGVLSLVVNRDRFQAHLGSRGLAVPRAWSDLLRPAYLGHVAVPSPITTGSGYVLMATQVFRLGEEGAFEYLKRLVANASHVTPTALLPIYEAAQGKAIVAISWAHDALVAEKGGQPLEMIVPPDTGYEISGVSIVKGGPNVEGAKAFVDFLLTRAAQEIAARFGLRYPTRPDATPPAGLPPLSALSLVRYDRGWAAQNKERLQKRWQAEILSDGGRTHREPGADWARPRKSQDIGAGRVGLAGRK